MNKSLLLVLACILAFGAHARAATLTTSPSNTGLTNGVNCVATNVGKKALAILVEVHLGSAVIDSKTMMLDPGGSDGKEYFNSGFYYCRFSFPGSAKQVRAAMQVIDANYVPYATEPAR